VGQVILIGIPFAGIQFCDCSCSELYSKEKQADCDECPTDHGTDGDKFPGLRNMVCNEKARRYQNRRQKKQGCSQRVDDTKSDKQFHRCFSSKSKAAKQVEVDQAAS
jgi:hypothetical protein